MLNTNRIPFDPNTMFRLAKISPLVVDWQRIGNVHGPNLKSDRIGSRQIISPLERIFHQSLGCDTAEYLCPAKMRKEVL